MTHKKNIMKIVFFGSSKFVLPILEVLRKNYDLSLVLTTENLETEPVRSYCKQHNLPCIPVLTFDHNTKYLIQNTKALLGVLAYFGLILPKEVLEIFPNGILNVHPSLLPKYRGPTPGQTAILNGETKTGVTLIKLDEEVDHGPILAQVEERIKPTDTTETLYERLFRNGARLLHQNIKKYIKGELKETPQNHAKATFTKHLERQDGFIDLTQPPPLEQLDRMIRAYHPWPGVWTTIRIKDEGLRMKFLPAEKIQVEGGRPMTYKDFLNGYLNIDKALRGLLS